VQVSAAGVAAVVVTYNRRDLLTECLAAIEDQTTPPQWVIVVDNASTDGTAEMLARHAGRVDVVSLQVNTGGAGGFAAGVAAAMTRRPEAVWLLDDDTIPEPDALAGLLRARSTYPGRRRPALVASRVVWTDGRDHPMNTPRTRPGVSADEVDAAASIGCRPIRSASFVSVLVDAAAVDQVGLPVADYFLWNDDFEYTARLLRDAVGVHCPASVVVHKTRTFGSTDADPGERFYYEVRNKAWLFARSPALTPVEKVLYGGSTVRRWARTIAGSSQRDVLWDGLRRGLREARRPPRPTETVLAAAGAAGLGHDG
jgi:rhamnopyranosyl-N-acetylglucosaminyl-diphospho-decaprenol beta-1,3/1,4-galactofuranosyltransferase